MISEQVFDRVLEQVCNETKKPWYEITPTSEFKKVLDLATRRTGLTLKELEKNKTYKKWLKKYYF